MARLLIDQMSTRSGTRRSIPNEYRQALEKLLASKRKFAVPTEARGRGEEGTSWT